MTRPHQPLGTAFAAKLAVLGVACAAVLLGHPAGAAGHHDDTAPVIGGERLGEAGVVVAPGVTAPPVNEAASYVVADVDTGEVLAAKAAHQQELPASTLKVLTALTLLPKLDPTEIVVGTDEAANIEGSKAGIYPGLKYSLDLVFKAMLLQSGNDAAETLALAAGGVDETVAAMNDVADDLHALDTLAANPSGLDAPGQVTSAYDLALITRAALARDDFRAYIATTTADMPDVNGATYQIQNENQFFASYPGAIGGKNGYTTVARHTFVGIAERDGRTLVVTVMKTENRPEPIVSALMDWGFTNAGVAPVGELIGPADDLPAPSAKASQARSVAPDGVVATADSTGIGPPNAASSTAVDAPDAGGGFLKGVAEVFLVLLACVAVLRARVLWRQRRRS